MFITQHQQCNILSLFDKYDVLLGSQTNSYNTLDMHRIRENHIK